MSFRVEVWQEGIRWCKREVGRGLVPALNKILEDARDLLQEDAHEHRKVQGAPFPLRRRKKQRWRVFYVICEELVPDSLEGNLRRIYEEHCNPDDPTVVILFVLPRTDDTYNTVFRLVARMK